MICEHILTPRRISQKPSSPSLKNMSNCQMHYTKILLVHTTYSEVLRVAAAVQNKEVRDGFRALSHLRRRQQAPLPEGKEWAFHFGPTEQIREEEEKNTQCNASNLRSPCNAITYHTIPEIPCKYHAIFCLGERLFLSL